MRSPVTSCPRKRSGYKRRPSQRRRRSPRKSKRRRSYSSDEDFSPPPSDDQLLRNVNSAISMPDAEDSPSQESPQSTEEVLDPELCDDASDGSDVTWTPSIDDEDSDDELDLEDKLLSGRRYLFGTMMSPSHSTRSTQISNLDTRRRLKRSRREYSVNTTTYLQEQ